MTTNAILSYRDVFTNSKPEVHIWDLLETTLALDATIVQDANHQVGSKQREEPVTRPLSCFEIGNESMRIVKNEEGMLTEK